MRTANARMYASTTHCSRSIETPRSRCIDGSVASTIRLSSVIMKSAAPVRATAQMCVLRVVTKSPSCTITLVPKFDGHRTCCTTFVKQLGVERGDGATHGYDGGSRPLRGAAGA